MDSEELKKKVQADLHIGITRFYQKPPPNFGKTKEFTLNHLRPQTNYTPNDIDENMKY